MNLQNLIQVRSYLKGKKTYIISAIMIIVPLLNLIIGDITFVEFINSEQVMLLLGGGGFAALRSSK